MFGRGPPHEWPGRPRYATAAATGLAWALLWLGLDKIAAPPAVFWLASALLFSPVLVVLARDWADLAMVLLNAYVASLAAVVAAAAPGAAGIPRLVGLATMAWIGAWLAVLALFALRVRSGTLRSS